MPFLFSKKMDTHSAARELNQASGKKVLALL